jgi:pimeloyl-ACP methyl ester carboxylesterase
MRITTRQLSENLHKISGLFLRSAGFKLERWGCETLQNKSEQSDGPCSGGQGPGKIGLWRKPLRSRQHKNRNKGPFVLIPGFADSPLSWLPTITMLQSDLSRHFDELVLMEFPGFHGYLFNERCFESIDAMVQVSVSAMDALNPHTVMGHSLGGALAAHYAAIRGYTYPNGTNLKQVILIAPSGVFVDRDFRTKIENRIRELVENGIECLRELRPSLLEKENRLHRLVGELMTFASQEEIRQFVRSFRDDHLLEPLLPQVKAHVDLIWGEKDSLIPPAVIPCWLSALKQTSTRIIELEGVGHAPQFEAPVKLTSVLSRLIQPVAAPQVLGLNPGDPQADPFSAEIFSLLR